MKPEFLRAEYFHPDNLGFGLVGKLEGRQRPIMMTVEQGLEQAIKGFKGSRRVRTRIEEGGFTTIVSLIYATTQQLQNIVGPTAARRVDQSLADFFEDLKITPSQRLLGAIRYIEPSPMPASREAEFDSAVNNALDSITNHFD